MKNTIRVIRTQRKFTDDFKRKLVMEYEKGNFSVVQLSKLYNLQRQQIYNWIYKFSTFNEKGSRIIEMKESSTSRLKSMEERIKELERAVGQKQIQIEYLEKMIDIAKTDLNIDIKKNFDTPQSGGSGKTRIK
jgi:transposase-like protein